MSKADLWIAACAIERHAGDAEQTAFQPHPGSQLIGF